MGGGRGLTMRITTDCWETGRFIYQKLENGMVLGGTRNFLALVDKGDGKGLVQFDPQNHWPRPPLI